MVLYRGRSLETTVKIRLKNRSRRLKSKSWDHQRTPDSREHKSIGVHQMPPYLYWNQAPPKCQQVPEQDIPCKFSSNTGTQPWASIYRLHKVTPNNWHLITHYWTLHCTPERRNSAPPTRTPTQGSLNRKPWYASLTTPPTARKLHNKENSTNGQNTERTPQTQQFKQDEETEEYPADKGTGKMPTKPNKRGRDRESTW